MYGCSSTRQHAQPLGQRGQHDVELAGRARPWPASTAPAPRRSGSAPHALPDLLERLRQLGAVEQRRDPLGEPVEVRRQRRVEATCGHARRRGSARSSRSCGWRGCRSRWRARSRSAASNAGRRDRAVLAERHVAQQVEAQRVGAEALDRPRTGRARCRATCSSSRRPSAGSRGRTRARAARQLGGHQQRRPVDRVELQDVLADQVVASPARTSRSGPRPARA